MIPQEELKNRLDNLRNRLNTYCPQWEIAVITQKVSLYYLTGTMASGTLWIERDGRASFFVRRGYERAVIESKFPDMRRMNSFRDMAADVNNTSKSVLLEKNSMPLSFFELFNKYFNFETIGSLDSHLMAIRAVKSPFEINRIRKAGKIHALVLEELVPKMLKEGMSEAELSSTLLKTLIDNNAHGIARLNMHDMEFLLGYVGFSENNLMVTNFDGPDGNTGLHPSAPFMGSRDRKLKKGDIIFIDIGCGYKGYHTDKTSVYAFGKAPSQEVVDIHNKCVDVMNKTAAMLKPGNIPSQIYENIMAGLDDEFKTNFMGIGNSAVKFLGHSIGLHIDEMPAIAKGFDEPLQENMVIALEPKKAIENIGMVGTENTFIVTPNGGQLVTGSKHQIIVV
ncbi:MAG: M24 family metallopeptidase [Sedimentisphaeraceae bacterium JB056]